MNGVTQDMQPTTLVNGSIGCAQFVSSFRALPRATTSMSANTAAQNCYSRRAPSPCTHLRWSNMTRRNLSWPNNWRIKF